MEVISLDGLMDAGSVAEACSRGKARMEGEGPRHAGRRRGRVPFNVSSTRVFLIRFLVMSDIADPLLPRVRCHFEQLLGSHESAREAVSWAQEQLDHDSWRNEVTFQGLMLLADLVAAEWVYSDENEDARNRLFRSYWDWMEVVRWYEDDPIAWNANYYRRQIASFEDGFGTERAKHVALSLAKAGDLTDDEVDRWFS